jgi:protein-disulfide isomerase
MRLHRPTSLAAALPVLLAAAACNEYPVEHCAAGQGIALDPVGVPLRGPADAAVDLVLFGDLQCPYTSYAILLLDAYLSEPPEGVSGGRVRLLFRHFPLEQIHPRARAAALALAAAHRQGDDAFWRLARVLSYAEDLSDEALRSYASVAGLDLPAFDADYADPSTAIVVDRDLALAAELQLPGTPSFILCGVPVSHDPEEVIANIDAILER